MTPELQMFVSENIRVQDEALTPISRNIPGADRYRWKLPEQVQLRSATTVALQRTLNARRKLPPPAMRKLQIEDTDRVARRYGDMIGYNAAEVFVDLPLLKQLNRRGALGGRKVTVWLSRFPLKLLHELLDQARLIYPEASDLGDFRADERDVDDEWQALVKADCIITPHAFLADRMKQFVDGEKVQQVGWELPNLSEKRLTQGRYIFFSGPTSAREGAYAVREAARRPGLPVVAGGRHLESSDFWQGVKLLPAASHPLQNATVVVCHAVMKNRPTPILNAISNGIPVIVTPECGLDSTIPTVKFGDADALIEAIRGLFADCPTVI